ncbi:molybdate ABC transporter substrate-binding protein [Lederbergia wuyishanensis]|uniref:Molybdate transport system substrate-binding protein n=1 Tax=Lederbergia wuyishanensis TaxID=1347903 RepID=A0ABU0D333_9BACI|nr:molybdate ABC transporter substrate-binding protein [Lederbergia wuyishanensis]MCJ8007051.1 molybdate ABC transporter substrate-binding protein [Lederbergia wuyishanensis]MDQ0342805.1 molybdate transport system substrate-binding protein [Lederbergia wuyishanensis]
MKKAYLRLIPILIIILTSLGCSNNNSHTFDTNVELTISAAASLQNALNDIKLIFEEENPHIKLNFNFGASGALQQQISQGAPVDLIFSAAEDKFNKLVEDGRINQEQGIDLIGNELVLVVPVGSNKGIKSFEDLVNAKQISIGTPEAVPAGQYAKETLVNLKLWGKLEKKIIYAKDVRQVLTYVETNNVDAGIVYKTDAFISSKVNIVATAKESTHAPIIYPVGVIKDSPHQKEAQRLYEFLQNETAIEIFEKYGFKGLK